MALGKKCHGGRVTGVGVGVTNRDYFRSMHTKKEYMDLVTKLCSRVKSLEHQVKNLKRARSDKEKGLSEEKDEEEDGDADVQPSPTDNTDETNATTKLDIPDIPEGVTPCQLALSSPQYRLVAFGKVHKFNTSTVMHTEPIPPGFVRVAIDYAIEKETPLPVPLDGEANLIREAIGTIVFWGIELVVLDKMAVDTSKHQERKSRSISTIPMPQVEFQKATTLPDIEPQNGTLGREILVNVDILPENLMMFYKYVLKMNKSEQIRIPINIGITSQSKGYFLVRWNFYNS